MERQIYLHGSLAKQYGKDPITINADTTVLIIQGLICRFGNKFKQAIREGKFHILKGKTTLKDDIGENEVRFTLGKVTELHLIPVITGRSAVVRIVVGVVLLVVAFYTGNPELARLGAVLILGGAIELLTPKPKLGSTDQEGNNPSFMFNGSVNVTEQGGPVPIILGRMRRCGSVVLSAGLTVEKLSS